MSQRVVLPSIQKQPDTVDAVRLTRKTNERRGRDVILAHGATVDEKLTHHTVNTINIFAVVTIAV